MWKHTGHVFETAFMGVTLEAVTSDSGEGVGFDVVRRGHVIGRVQEYNATIEAGKGMTLHSATWSFAPLGNSYRRWAKSAGQTIFGFGTRDDAVRYGVNH